VAGAVLVLLVLVSTPAWCGTDETSSPAPEVLPTPTPEAAPLPTSIGERLALSSCHGLGTLLYPVLWPLTLGDYDRSTWFNEEIPCYTLLTNTAMSIGGLIVGSVGHPHRPPVFGAGSFDIFFRDALRSRAGNEIFSSGVGAVLVPAVGSGAVLLAASAIGGFDGYADSITRALPLLGLGLGGTSLPNNAFKRAFGRDRPFIHFAEPSATGAAASNSDGQHESFYSGHATAAFFSAAFLDPILADILRWKYPQYSLQGDAPWDMRALRVGQGVVLYGLATAVGYQRIQTDQHYMTDVLLGAFMGGLQGQLTYRWGYRRPASTTLTVSAYPGGRGLMLSWRF